jgi:hypothetical protein
MFLIFRRFSLNPEGGEGEGGMDQVWTGRDLYSLPAGPVRQGKKSGSAGGLSSKVQ